MLFRVVPPLLPFPVVSPGRGLNLGVEVPEAEAAVETVNEEWDGDKGSGDGGDICRFLYYMCLVESLDEDLLYIERNMLMFDFLFGSISFSFFIRCDSPNWRAWITWICATPEMGRWLSGSWTSCRRVVPRVSVICARRTRICLMVGCLKKNSWLIFPEGLCGAKNGSARHQLTEAPRLRCQRCIRCETLLQLTDTILTVVAE